MKRAKRGSIIFIGATASRRGNVKNGARVKLPDKDDSFFIKPDDGAGAAFRLTEQKPSARSKRARSAKLGEKNGSPVCQLVPTATRLA